MPKAMAFLATADAPRARRFYEEVVGLRFIEEHDFAVVFDAFGTMLRIQKTPSVVALPYTAFGLEVDDIAVWIDRLSKSGVTGVRYPHFEQDERGIWKAPGGASIFWFHDPDGHLISLTQF